MKRYLVAAAAVCLCASASADAVFVGGELTVRLQEKPCEPPVSLLVKEEILPISKAGVATLQGRDIRLCWAVLRAGLVTILDEEGDGGTLPLTGFKEDPGI